MRLPSISTNLPQDGTSLSAFAAIHKVASIRARTRRMVRTIRPAASHNRIDISISQPSKPAAPYPRQAPSQDRPARLSHCSRQSVALSQATHLPEPAMPEIVTAAMLVIGDEILSGRTKDKNIGHLADIMTAIGIDLKEVRIVP